MGTLITLFSPPLEQKILRPEACRQGREGRQQCCEESEDRAPRGLRVALLLYLAQLAQGTGMAAAACCAPLPVPGVRMGQLLGAAQERKCVLSSLKPRGKKGHLRISGVGHSGIGACLASASVLSAQLCSKCLDLVSFLLHFSRSRHVGKCKYWFSQHWGKFGQTSCQKGWDSHLHYFGIGEDSLFSQEMHLRE